MTAFTSLLEKILFFGLVSTFIYWVDGKFGKKIYTWWYNLTHSEPLHELSTRAFVVGQPISRRISVVFALILFQDALLIWAGQTHLMTALVSSIPESIGLLLGFYAAPFVLFQWRKKDAALKYLDRVERGEINLVHDAASGLREAVKGATNLVVDDPFEEKNQTPTPKAEPVPVEEEPKIDPHAALKKYLDRG